MTTTNEIVPPVEYEIKSKEIDRLYNLFSKTGQDLDKVVLESRTILENSGYSRTEAMKKIADDHKHPRGFSLPNLYRMLPKEDKQYQTSKVRIDGSGEQKKDSQNENDFTTELEESDNEEDEVPTIKTDPKFVENLVKE
ncbi:MAG: hypothetical protein ACR2IS_05905, partial [Nitrososphaeraceae archaeon]